jgi:hypothetical protein
MAKAGDEYQVIVGAVAQALDPKATVKVGQWIEGPDGRRDLDVEVRGTIDGSPCFVLIECKDWTNRVGIGVVDALESKRRDLNADRAIIYSNSGFTDPALRKAARVGIEMASALKAGDNRIKLVVERQIVAKVLSVDSMISKLHQFPGEPFEVEEGWQISQLLCDQLPVMNWISDLSCNLIREHEDAKEIAFRCVFRPYSGWTYNGRSISVGGLELFFKCSKKWVAQTVREDVTLGLYDYIRRSVTIPDQQMYVMGWIDNKAWVEVDAGWEETELQPGSFELYLTMLDPIAPIQDTERPRIEELIAEREIIV